MRNTMLAAVAALALIGGSAVAQTDDTMTENQATMEPGSDDTTTPAATEPTTMEPAVDATTTATMTTQPTMAGGTIGQSVTDSSGTVVGVVSDIQLGPDNTLSGVVIKDSTGSFVAPPEKLMRNTDGTLMLAATAEEITNWPMLGGDSVGESKGGAEANGEDQGTQTN